MNGELAARLRAAGVEDTVALGATIRPTRVDGVDGLAETLAQPRDEGAAPRSLPRLSVDLGAVEPLPAPGPPAARARSTSADLEVRGLIGEGGMGRVLLARQHSLARDVAIKTTRDVEEDRARTSLLVEGAITGHLEHPAIVPVHALGLDAAGRPAIVMKRIEGVEWRALAKDPAHPGWAGWEGDAGDRLPGHLQIFVAVCNAVHYAHSRGYLHRDIKLENVLIGRFGDVYLADWGVATCLGETAESLAGTPGYMAPEMVVGGVLDERTDVYLLGATLHELLTGRLRHEAPVATAALLSALESAPFPYGPEVPPDLAELLHAACHREPSARPPSAQALRDAVLQHLRHRESAALAAAARDRLARAEALLEEADAGDGDARIAIDRLLSEARFAFEQALSDWRGDERTRAARDRLEALVQARAARSAALEREAHERDPRIAARQRAYIFAAIAVAGALVSVSAVLRGRAPTPLQFALYPSLMLAIALAMTWVLRRRVFATTYNTRFALMGNAVVAFMTVSRWLGLLRETSPAEHLTRESFMVAAALTIWGLAYTPWLLWVALCFFAVFLVGALFPSVTMITFAFGGVAGLLVAAGFQWRRSLRPPAG